MLHLYNRRNARGFSCVCAHDRLHRRLPAEGKPLRAIVVHKKRFSARPTCKALQQGDFARSRDSRHRKQS